MTTTESNVVIHAGEAVEVKTEKPKTESEVKAKADFRKMIVPLGKVVDTNYSRIMDSIPLAGDTAVALRAILTLWHTIWHLPNAEWQRVRGKVKLGFVKETKDCGNTSVSMGAAVMYFQENPSAQAIGFINAGSGGNKYQLYVLSERVISVKYEFKPKNGSSPGRITAGGYVPSGNSALDDEKNQKMLVDEINEFQAAVEKKIGVKVPIRAFVTGKFRNYWETAEPFAKADMDDALLKYFSAYKESTIHPTASGICFALPQEIEGSLEAIGTTEMYSNLATRGYIDSGVGVVSINGIGNGSTQIVCQSYDRVENFDYRFGFGMSDPDNLAMLPWNAITKFIQSLPELVDWIDETAEPVIALKSGCMLFIDSEPGAQTRAEIFDDASANPELADFFCKLEPISSRFAESLKEFDELINKTSPIRARGD